MLKLKRVVMEVIPHADQKYDTMGDYWWDDEETLHVITSDLGDSRYNFSVLLHEFIEAVVCQYKGISAEKITSFDLEWEKLPEAEQGPEPGFHLKAPYFHQHALADTVERMVAPSMDFWVDEMVVAYDRLPMWKPKE